MRWFTEEVRVKLYTVDVQHGKNEAQLEINGKITM